jgi:thiol-disulfide isomerase/thioredoxin
VPENESNREYLGLCGKQETTTLGRIGAEVLIVEIFSMYCPHCQKHAPKANELFHAIEGSDKYRGRIKLIGIGVGNSAFEVDIFRQKYAPPFPLFDDRTAAALGSLGGIRTPHYFVLRLRDGALRELVYSQSGGFTDTGAFLEEIARASGL